MNIEFTQDEKGIILYSLRVALRREYLRVQSAERARNKPETQLRTKTANEIRAVLDRMLKCL